VPETWGNGNVLTANINQRHMTKGQLAMAVAMVYPDGDKGGRGKKANLVEKTGFSQSRLQRARTVLRYCPPDTAALVLRCQKI